MITLKAARVNAEMTQEEASARLGVSQNTLCKWERGERLPRVDMAERIADLYGTNVENIDFKRR